MVRRGLSEAANFALRSNQRWKIRHRFSVSSVLEDLYRQMSLVSVYKISVSEKILVG